ncbi:MAG: rRNA maturation RNase YbeY [Tenericutes bacterium]|nr:rRNA maturation RNase YbeY [Mycoplasmatota bacterium]
MNIYEIFNETNYNLEKETKKIYELLAFALKREKLENVEFNIIFVDSDTIHEINRNYRHVDRVTDVISFALEDNETITLDHRVLGDIYICVERAEEQAKEYGHSFLRELAFLSIHGLLHLLGYDHMEKEEEKIMFSKQEDILNEFGIRRDSEQDA